MNKKLFNSKDIEKSIVQVFSEFITPSYSQPWTNIKGGRGSGTGFCIEVPHYLNDKFKSVKNKDKYIITNAHCVHNSTYTTVRKRGTASSYKFRIDNIIYECDLAILSIDTDFYQHSKQKKDLSKIMEEFWHDIVPLKIGGLPSKLDTVYVYGFPLGGYNISITSGTANRIQIIPYFDASKCIAIQIDAPINFGNSGGPVVDVKGDVIGVAFSGEDDRFTQNMGYIIPTTLIRYFIEKIKEKTKFKGLCSLGIYYQPLNNIILREFLGLKRTDTGILVANVEKYGSSDDILKKMDVIIKINDRAVDNDGTMRLFDIISDIDPTSISKEGTSDLLQEGEVAPFANMVAFRKNGSTIKLTILRDAKIMDVIIELKPKQFLIPMMEYQIKPSYYIIAGLVFIPLSLMLYVEKKQNKEYVANLTEYIERQEVKSPDEQIIILSQIFTTEITEDYPDDNFILASVNDIEILNLAHLHSLIKKELSKSTYLKFTFKDIHKIAVLNVADVNKYQKDIIYENIGDFAEYVPS